jgi:quercetin dioxygenase-like cupin family protein
MGSGCDRAIVEPAITFTVVEPVGEDGHMTMYPSTPPTAATVARLDAAEKIPFGPLAHYQPLIGGDDGPIFTGVQTCAPGYQTPPHFHPYVECLFIVEGNMEAWLIGEEANPTTLQAGDMISLPAEAPHAFRNPGPGVLRLLGIHNNPTRIVHRLDASEFRGPQG